MENCISIHVLCIFKGKYLKRWLKLMDCSAAENVFIQTENAKTAEFLTYMEKDISLFYSFFSANTACWKSVCVLFTRIIFPFTFLSRRRLHLNLFII